MIAPGFLYAFAFTLVLLYVAVLRRPALRIGLVDRPTARKNHQGEVPLIGGIAMFLALLTCNVLPGITLSFNPPFLGSAFVLIVFGALDDRFELRVKVRLLVQCLAAAAIAYAGVHIDHLGNLLGTGDLILPGAVNFPLTVIAITGVINAINMIDGVDGLAGSIVFGILFWFGWAATMVKMPQLAIIANLLAAITLGFLVFNLRHPWRTKACIFMGDAGSMMLGLALAWLSVVLAQGSHHGSYVMAVPPVTVLWILGVPVIETLSVMIARIRRGISPFAAGRDHLHHLLLHLGLGEARLVLAMALLSFLFGSIGIAGWLFAAPDWLMFSGFVMVTVSYVGCTGWAWSSLTRALT